MVVSPDARRAIVAFYQVLNRPVPGAERLRLRGLDPSTSYRVTAWPAGRDTLAVANVGVHDGAELMGAGLRIDASREETTARGDFWSRLFVLVAE